MSKKTQDFSSFDPKKTQDFSSFDPKKTQNFLSFDPKKTQNFSSFWDVWKTHFNFEFFSSNGSLAKLHCSHKY